MSLTRHALAFAPVALALGFALITPGYALGLPAIPVVPMEEPQGPPLAGMNDADHREGPPPHPPGMRGEPHYEGGPRGRNGGERYTPPSRWWSNPYYIQYLSLTADQQKKIEDVFNSHRLTLIDLSANLQKQEAILEPLLDAEHPDENKILSQIDRVAAARADLEKGNARMLLGFRRVLSQEQWKRLVDAPRPEPPPRRH